MHHLYLTCVVALAAFLAGLLLGWRHGFVRPAARKGAGPARAGRGTRPIVLYVGNLSYKLREGELRKLFAKAGKVVSVRIIKNRFNGESKGYGFIEMACKADARNAIGQFDGTSIGGRQVVVSEAKSNPKMKD